MTEKKICAARWNAKLQGLEQLLDTQDLSKTKHLVSIIGFGEISTILQFHDEKEWVIKRLPLFDRMDQAQRYLERYRQYNRCLEDADIKTARGREHIIKKTGCDKSPLVLYLLQQAFPADQIGNRALKKTDARHQRLQLVDTVMHQIDKIFAYNQTKGSEYQLSCDGQISNWAIATDNTYFLDTSTPLFRRQGQEQLEYELLLKSTPGILRGVIRAFFLQDVLNRYYDQRLVYVDLIANLIKEELPDLVPPAIELANARLAQPIREREVRGYYREDKFTWSLFLRFRKIDRWLHQHVYHQPYQYILPEKVMR